MPFQMIHPYLTLVGGVWILSGLSFAGCALARMGRPRSVLLLIGMWGSLLAWCAAIAGLILLATVGDSVVPTRSPTDMPPERVEQEWRP